MKLIILLMACVMLLPASITKLDKNNGYDDLDKKILKLIVSKNKNKNKRLLIPIDIRNTFSVLKYYKDIYNQFIEKRKVLKINKGKNKLYKLYVYTFKNISENILIDSMQLTSRSNYEMRILKKLKIDLNEEHFLAENKDLLMISIKELLSIDKFMMYEIQKRQNIFYAQNIKQYLSLGTKVSHKVIENSNMYIYFIQLLNEGETLIHDSINLKSFDEFEKFMERIKVSDEDMQSLLRIKDKNILMNTYINYWIRGQVYGRYLEISMVWTDDLKCIEKEKVFFENL